MIRQDKQVAVITLFPVAMTVIGSRFPDKISETGEVLMRIPKINTNRYGEKWIAAGVIIGVVIPLILWLIVGRIFWIPVIIGGCVLVSFLIVFVIEMKQDFGKVPYEQRHLREEFSFDPERQIAIVRSSICTGEKVAGFRDKETGRFTEVMLIRSEDDMKKFREAFQLDQVKTEY